MISRATHKTEAVAPEMTLTDTLRVLELARGLKSERADAEAALARDEVTEQIRQRLRDAARITGDSITEADIDSAIDQYFATQNAYRDPPFSFSVFLAHLYIRRAEISMIIGLVLVVGLAWTYFF